MTMTAALDNKANTRAMSYDPTGVHQTESVYSTVLSSTLHLHDVNRVIHSIQSLPHWLEFIVFLFGYAFNPVSMPLWMVVVTSTSAQSSSSIKGMILQPSQEGSIPTDLPLVFAPTFYLATVVVTLLGTELCKACFRATRPEAILSTQFRSSKIRRYGKLVASLKSKYSFPSGDSAQAANLVLVFYYYIVPSLLSTTLNINNSNNTNKHGVALQRITVIILAFGVFYPGVAFARVFYHCHWIEDCFGGAILAFLLHWTMIPGISDLIASHF